MRMWTTNLICFLRNYISAVFGCILWINNSFNIRVFLPINPLHLAVIFANRTFIKIFCSPSINVFLRKNVESILPHSKSHSPAITTTENVVLEGSEQSILADTFMPMAMQFALWSHLNPHHVMLQSPTLNW